MADETNILDQLISRVPDESLRSHLARQVDLLRGSRHFGLVFDRHLPESVRLVDYPIRKGVRVALRDESSMDTWIVTGFADPTRQVAVLSGEGGERLVTDLLVVREFGEEVYPGLRSVERIPNGPDDAPWHAVINGENYHALQALRTTHREKIDLIYIDPPYNTGGKRSWLYNDKFVDSSDRAKSSKWLSFMERRFNIAWQLLKPTGAIMVSIGDDEQHRLRMLMDQVFGADNCVNVITVEMSTTSGPKTVNAQQGTIVKNIEYVLIYRKSEAFDQVAHTPLMDSVEGWAPNYTLWLHDDGTLGLLSEQLLAADAVRADIEHFGLAGRRGFSMKNMETLLAVSAAAKSFVEDNVDRIARTDRLPVSCQGQNPPRGKYAHFQAENRTYILTTLDSGTEVQVIPLSMNYRWSDDHKPKYGRTVIRGDLWKGFFKDMARVDQEGGFAFSNGKKPIRLIKQLVRWANNSPDAVVLDFFGGSGTTAHAVMQMNADDGGRRQSILVTNNEVAVEQAQALRRKGVHPSDPEWEQNGVFEAVTRPRISTVVKGTRPDGSQYSNGLAANVEMFDLVYLDPSSIRRGIEFFKLAPLFWLQGGARGDRIEADPGNGWVLTATYGVLFDIDTLVAFADAVTAAATTGEPPSVLFIVTDSLAEYQQAVERLPVGIDTVQLYEDYLLNYADNFAGGIR
ncbi:adenine specific DNA methylase Mod [Mycobacteroides abscessus subsp. massiliense]|uniref:site-specific DNA-methyltransferase n=1 Tax=Mycobacteroides abscessus TaxID=36809 RepID=UPI00092B61D3|nr:site-specific DNA-methyltransferase [Mycobacteroides abscessus]SHR63651.1 adenine specific DNA methylase Mod [Mycobacteroides abscessus subsp. abscessus]SKG48884.1 adenine specific DNA methylase Mod [Mycobacteroides abscessus subsp. massiliense]SKH00229.1 adenine specific DNA methylase Mod [Mycobacteroides abscessus subsp. massiliense]SKH98139.1 adenine specific DNA methylase Mod [Mycobacteroides abscessus subsp. massiliense]SKJ27135.1 adenine specific DNA methylase Mod [Mycobacteroides abs